MATMAPDEKRTFMLTTPLHRLIPALALPAIAGMIITSAYNLADTFFVSQLGTYATGAVGVNGSIDIIVMMIGGLLATGASSYTARLLGAGQDKRAEQALCTCYYLALGIGLLMLIFGSLFTDPLMRLLGANDVILPYCRQYARYVMLAAPFMCSNLVLNYCLRAEGSSMYSMMGMVLGAVLNIVLDPIFIFDWGLGLGVAGASMATAISKLVTWLILMWPYWSGRTLLKLRLKSVHPAWTDAKEVLVVGSSAFLRNACGTLAAVLLNRIAIRYGESALAAVSVANRITFFITSACLGWGQGFQPAVGFAWGAGRYDRVREGFRFAAWACVLGVSAVALLVGIFATPVMLLFTEEDQELVRIGVFSLRLQCLAMPVHGYCIVANMLAAGLGRGRDSVLMGISRQGIFFLPLLPLLPPLLGVWGVAAIQGVADILSLLLAYPLARKALSEVRGLEMRQLESAGV